VFQVAGGCGLGALQAARENNVWGIGVDSDQRYLGPHIMASALKRVDKAVEELTTHAANGTLKTGSNYTFSLENDGVGLGSVSPRIPQALVDETIAIGEQIGAGTLGVEPTIKF
jgi:basic membrane protein A